MEIILGIDNLIFISILSSRLDKRTALKARLIGLSLALGIRISLLFALVWIIRLTEPVLTIGSYGASWRDLILLAGGLFLLYKSVTEIHHKLEGETQNRSMRKPGTFGKIVLQIVALDIIFSFDSILTAIGLTDLLWVMITAVTVAMILMFPALGWVSRLIEKHPSLKVLALSFLLLIGFMLVLDGLHHHIPKGYIYFAMFFSLFVEWLNIRITRRSRPVKIWQPRFENPENPSRA